MASPAKPSFSSSSSIPFKINPNMKKSELNDPMRKSFSGNPFTKPSVITNRRSFNPTTPANSPSDFPRRHSTSRECVASGDPEKENSRDSYPKPARVKSPAVSKGTKNFMSPTISAASKINASPRKQILVERNEPVRPSVSFSDVKGLTMEDNESTPEVVTLLKQKKEVSVPDVESVIMEANASIPTIGSNQKKVSFSDVKSIINEDIESTPEISLNQKVSFAADNESNSTNLTHDSQSSHHGYEEEPLKSRADFEYKETENDYDSVPETVTEEKDSVNVDPSFKISPREPISPSCPVLASLDSDSLMLPYDPKTNYLSPRPQFLHYRPNPRIQLYQQREGKQLDQLFASESYSDTDVTAETSTGSERDSEDISFEETMEEGEEEEELHATEPDQNFKAKRMSKTRFSTRSKFITLLLFLGFAYFSVLVLNSPAFAPGLEEISLSNFQVPQEVTEFAKANLNRFTQNLEHWSASFLSYVSNIIMSSSREVHKLGPLQYANLSHLMVDHTIEEGKLIFDSSPMKPAWERDAGTELLDDKQHNNNEEEEQENEALELVSEQPDEVQQGVQVEMMIDLDHLEAEENEEQQGIQVGMIELVDDHLEAEESKGVEEFSVQIEAEQNSNVDIKDQQSIIMSPQATEIQHNMSETGGTLFPEEVKPEKLTGGTLFPEEVKPEKLNSAESSQIADFTIRGKQEDLFLTKNNVMGFSLLVLCLLAAASAFIYIKRGKQPSKPNASMPAEQPAVSKKSEYSPASVGSSSQNWETEEVDMANESSSYPSQMMSSFAKTSSYNSNKRLKESNEPCPSEMSSSDRTSSSYSKGFKESNQYQSQETKTRKTHRRRQSLASSDYSMGSPSYGSFTTLEKIHKPGGGDEEIVTPVRRSSRIRSQVTSP